MKILQEKMQTEEQLLPKRGHLGVEYDFMRNNIMIKVKHKA